MITVFRIEHPSDGLGLFYREGDDPLRVDNIGLSKVYKRHEKFYTPESDSLDVTFRNKEWFCAYKTYKALVKWLKHKELKSLVDNGYKVLKIEVKEYQIGRYQALYTKESINKITDISRLFKKMTTTEKEFLETVVIPRLARMAIDCTLPSDLTQLKAEDFEEYPEVVKAFKYIQGIFPEVAMVVFDKYGNWLYMDESFVPPSFVGRDIDVTILNEASASISVLPYIYHP